MMVGTHQCWIIHASLTMLMNVHWKLDTVSIRHAIYTFDSQEIFQCSTRSCVVSTSTGLAHFVVSVQMVPIHWCIPLR